MNFKVFSVICLTFGSVFAEEVIECNDESRGKMDLYMMEMAIFGDPNAKYPTSPQELAEHCTIERQKLSWTQVYVEKCLSGVSKQMMTISVKDLDKSTKKYCDSPRLGKLLLSWSECGNKALNETVKCWQNYVTDIERIRVEKDRIPNADKTPLICCTYHVMDHCVEEAFISQGESICQIGAVKGLHSMLDEIAGRAIGIFCGDYAADNDKCDAVYKKYKYLQEIKFEKPIDKSPLNPFVDIVNSAGIQYDWKTPSD